MKRIVKRVGGHIKRHRIKYAFGVVGVVSGGVAFKIYGPTAAVKTAWIASRDLRVSIVTLGLSHVPWKNIKDKAGDFVTGPGKEPLMHLASGALKASGSMVTESTVGYVVNHVRSPVSELQKSADLKEIAVRDHRAIADVATRMATCSAIRANHDVARRMSKAAEVVACPLKSGPP